MSMGRLGLPTTTLMSLFLCLRPGQNMLDPVRTFDCAVDDYASPFDYAVDDSPFDCAVDDFASPFDGAVDDFASPW
jgi:hypothetical protein